jgi:hypothetical protein
MFGLLKEHQELLYWMAGVSLVLFAGTLALVPWMVVRIPADYFAGRKRDERRSLRHRSFPLWLALMIVKNLVGAVFVVAGIVMLALPGQGVLTMLFGLALMNYPGKYRLERWILSRGPALRLVNRLRRRRGRPALILDPP